MPDEVEQAIIDKKLKFYVIDAAKIARENGMGTRTNTVLQTAFFKLSGIKLAKADGTELDPIQVLKDYAEKAYSKKGQEVVEMNWKCIEAASAAIEEVKYPAAPAGKIKMPAIVSDEAPEFVKKVSAKMIAQKGNDLPVSAIPDDGTWPTATTQWEKRNVAAFIPAWDPTKCIQCGQCSIICPHAAIRLKVYDGALLEGAPETFKSADAKTPKMKALGSKVTVQVAPEDCMGCKLCVVQCPIPIPPPPSRWWSRFRCARARPRTGSSSSACRTWIPPSSTRSRFSTASSSARSSSSPARARAAARRPTSSCSPRSAAAHRERDRLLVHLRRQPAHHPVLPAR